MTVLDCANGNQKENQKEGNEVKENCGQEGGATEEAGEKSEARPEGSEEETGSEKSAREEGRR